MSLNDFTIMPPIYFHCVDGQTDVFNYGNSYGSCESRSTTPPAQSSVDPLLFPSPSLTSTWTSPERSFLAPGPRLISEPMESPGGLSFLIHLIDAPKNERKAWNNIVFS